MPAWIRVWESERVETERDRMEEEEEERREEGEGERLRLNSASGSSRVRVLVGSSLAIGGACGERGMEWSRVLEKFFIFLQGFFFFLTAIDVEGRTAV